VSVETGLWGLETAVQEFADTLVRSLPATVASVALWDQPSFALTVKAVGTRRPLANSPRVGSRIHLARAPWHRAVLERREPMFVERDARPVMTLEEEDIGDGLPLRAMYLMPIQVGAETIGILRIGEMRSSAREAFTQQKRDRCRAILDEFITGSVHAWESGRLRQQTRAMSSLLRLAQEVMEARSADEVFASCVAEVTDWIGAPVGGILFRTAPDGVMEPVAWRDLPVPLTMDDAPQLLLALVRSGGGGRFPVSVVRVADDPLDPLHPSVRPGETWTRVGLPLIRTHRLQGIACLYVADDLHPSNWEVEAFRRRGELVGLALGVVGALEEHRSEERWFGRAAYQLLTEHQQTALSETVASILDLVTTHLPPRLARLMAESASAGEGGAAGPSMADLVAGEVRAVLDPIRERIDTGALRLEPLDVNGIVRRAMVIAHARWDQQPEGTPPVIEYHVDALAEPLLVQASIALVGAIVHAIEDAVETLPDGGRVRLRTARDNGHVLIAVEGSGSGASPVSPPGAVVPLARGDDRGLELGLAVIQSLVDRHGGSVLHSRASGSSVLEIRLPALEGHAS